MGGCSSAVFGPGAVCPAACGACDRRQVRQEGLDVRGTAVPVQDPGQQLEVTAQRRRALAGHRRQGAEHDLAGVLGFADVRAGDGVPDREAGVAGAGFSELCHALVEERRRGAEVGEVHQAGCLEQARALERGVRHGSPPGQLPGARLGLREGGDQRIVPVEGLAVGRLIACERAGLRLALGSELCEAGRDPSHGSGPPGEGDGGLHVSAGPAATAG